MNLDPQKHARKSDPQTSKDAAIRIKEFASGHCHTILRALVTVGPQTIDELSISTGLTGVQIARRLPDLKDGGRALPTDDVRRGLGGRAQRIWRAL